jgi:heptaprenyl diphosphate synthase
MTPSTIELPVTADDYRIARYAAAAIALTVAEAALPSPLPGIKPGLANIIVLVVLVRYGWRDAAWVSLLRVVVGSLVIGQFLAPGFFLALAGALCSLGVLALAQHLPSRLFGPVSVSVLAAFAHIGGQIALPAPGWCRTTACTTCCRCSPRPRCCSAPSTAWSRRACWPYPL